MWEGYGLSGIQWDALMGQQEGYFVEHLTWLLPNPNPDPLWHNFNSEQTKAPKGSWKGIFAAVLPPETTGSTRGAVMPTPLCHPLPPCLHSWLLPGHRAAFVPGGKTHFIILSHWGLENAQNCFGKKNFFRDSKQDFIFSHTPSRTLGIYRAFQGKSLWEMQKESVFRQKVGRKTPKSNNFWVHSKLNMGAVRANFSLCFRALGALSI